MRTTPSTTAAAAAAAMMPIRREGMAVCETCGAVGVKDTYYTRERRFCSQQCAKSQSESATAGAAGDRKPPATSSTSASSKKTSGVAVAVAVSAASIAGQALDDVHVYSNKKRNLLKGTDKDVYGYDWVEMLQEPGFVAPPLSCFAHAPLCDSWASDVSVGLKVEVENTDTRQPAASSGVGGATAAAAAAGGAVSQSYWVASVVSVAGYKALLRYEGFGQDDSKDFWVNLAADDVHPVGWCASKGKPLIPPRTIQDKYTEWREFLVQRLTGARSLPYQFHQRVVDACRSRFRRGMTVELVDRNRLSTFRVGTVLQVMGRRLLLGYDAHESGGASASSSSSSSASSSSSSSSSSASAASAASASSTDATPFWCHEESPLMRPVGWAASVGHRLRAPAAYVERCRKKLAPAAGDATADLFAEPKTPPGGWPKFAPGMKLEAVDPLNLDTICVATVVRVLNHGYLMVRVDRCVTPAADVVQEADEDDDAQPHDPLKRPSAFCYHCTSACIAPAGFCEANAIPLKAPRDSTPAGRFRWGDYLRLTKAVAAAADLFVVKEERDPALRVGMRVEAADLMDPRLICVATIAQVAGRLVRVHFDGWSDEFDQWMDARSPEIYPVGWCELAGYRLEQPVVPAPPPPPAAKRGRAKKASNSTTSSSSSSSSSSTTPTAAGASAAAASAAAANGAAAAKSQRSTALSVESASPLVSSTAPDGSADGGTGRRSAGRSTGAGRSTRLSSGGVVTPPPPSAAAASAATTPTGARSLRSRKRAHSPSSAASASPPPPPSTLSAAPAAAVAVKVKEEVRVKEEPQQTTPQVTSPVTPTGRSSKRAANHQQHWNNRGDQNGGAEAALKTPTAAATPKPPTPPATSADAGARKTIPRLIDVAPAQRREALVGVAPLEWSVHDVVHFLRVNDCAACCDAFLDAKVDGRGLVLLSKDQVLELSSMKVGPSVKICDLIAQLKTRVTAAQLRGHSSPPNGVR